MLVEGALFCSKCGERVCSGGSTLPGAKNSGDVVVAEETTDRESVSVDAGKGEAVSSEKGVKTFKRSKGQWKIIVGLLVATIVIFVLVVRMNVDQTYIYQGTPEPDISEDTPKPETLQSDYETESYFDRNYYISNSVSIADFMRYQNDNISKPCFFNGCVVDNIPEDRIYICKCGDSWIIINDQNQSLHAQALVGDSVSVYGVYDGVGMISLTDGSTRQVPIIHADKLIDNEILPEDMDSFMRGVVEAMNNNIYGYGSGSEYISDSYAKLVVGASYSFDYANKVPGSLLSVDISEISASTLVGTVDGYQTVIETEWDENVVLPHELGIVTFADEEKYGWESKPVYVYGSFTNMELRPMFDVIRLTFRIDSFEAYDGNASIGNQIEHYYELSGRYRGNSEQSVLSLSIYSSQEEGVTEIGNVEISVGGSLQYCGNVIPSSKDTFYVETDTGGEVLLVKSTVDGIIVLELYVDGQKIEDYRMQEHYES